MVQRTRRTTRGKSPSTCNPAIAVGGIGRKLTDAVIEEARTHKRHSLIARVAGESSVSLDLSRTAGFADVGVMREVDRKFGRLLDAHILQKMFD